MDSMERNGELPCLLPTSRDAKYELVMFVLGSRQS